MNNFYYVKNFTNAYEEKAKDKERQRTMTVEEYLKEDDEEFAWLKEFIKKEERK